MQEYSLRQPESRPEYLPEIALLPPISHEGKLLDMALFGPNTYATNVSNMQKGYFHSRVLPNISFRKSLTQESISASAYGFGSEGEVDAKRDVFDPRWLQAGDIVRWDEGLFTNISELNPTNLRNMLEKVEKVRGIYILKNGVAFVPYESFKQGVQEGREFTESGLARGLEYTQKKVAKNLSVISSPEFYSRGVNVFGFGSVKNPTKKVVTLDSVRYLDHRQLRVDGDNWNDDDKGYASGVLVAKSASAD